MPNAQCPMPHAPCPMPYTLHSTPYTLKYDVLVCDRTYRRAAFPGGKAF
ncbi:MAG: hypothetical protein F6J93_09500 [Oscillatoria sp. SIO1A7]|nr:hypothetical protein [Oscillatoria sp. SIO1A7]